MILLQLLLGVRLPLHVVDYHTWGPAFTLLLLPDLDVFLVPEFHTLSLNSLVYLHNLEY